jgi:hypothetical protein
MVTVCHSCQKPVLMSINSVGWSNWRNMSAYLDAGACQCKPVPVLFEVSWAHFAGPSKCWEDWILSPWSINRWAGQMSQVHACCTTPFAPTLSKLYSVYVFLTSSPWVQKEGRLTILDSRWPSPAGAGFSSWEEAGLLLGCAVLHTDKLVAGSNIAQDLIFFIYFWTWGNGFHLPGWTFSWLVLKHPGHTWADNRQQNKFTEWRVCQYHSKVLPYWSSTLCNFPASDLAIDRDSRNGEA